ncbi:hypothetical protein [Nocardia sp. NPDC003979]
MSVENSADTSGTYREFDYTAIGGSPNYQGRWVSDSFQTAAPAGSTAYGNVNCTFLDPGTGQARVGYWQGSTRVKLPVRTIVPAVPPGGAVG